jgi:predicted RNA-binding protein with PUA-like domain
MAFWLMKSEPEVFGIAHLAKQPLQTAAWDGVRNYQARNYLKAMKVGDLAFFYHSNAKPPGIAGIMKISRTAYTDHTQFDPNDHHFDSASDPNNPRWVMVDVTLVTTFPTLLGLDTLRLHPALAELPLLQRGTRLSVMPIPDAAWHYINKLAMQITSEHA